MKKDTETLAAEALELAYDAWQTRMEALMERKDHELAQPLLDAHDALIAVSSSLERLSGETVDEVVLEAPDFDETRGEYLARLMDEHGVSLYRLSNETALSRSTIQRLLDDETSNPHRRTLSRLEQFFGLETGDLDE